MKDLNSRKVRSDDIDKKKSMGVLNVTITTFLILIAAMLVILVTLFVYQRTHPQDNTVLGYKPLRITTNSMEPAIKAGALVMAKQVPFDELEVRDIITFERSDGQLNTHRIISVENGGVRTQGDNAAYPDNGAVTAYTYRYKIVLIMNWTAQLNTLTGVLKISAWTLGTLLLILLTGLGIKKIMQDRDIREESAKSSDAGPVYAEAVPQQKESPVQPVYATNNPDRDGVNFQKIVQPERTADVYIPPQRQPMQPAGRPVQAVVPQYSQQQPAYPRQGGYYNPQPAVQPIQQAAAPVYSPQQRPVNPGQMPYYNNNPQQPAHSGQTPYYNNQQQSVYPRQEPYYAPPRQPQQVPPQNYPQVPPPSFTIPAEQDSPYWDGL